MVGIVNHWTAGPYQATSLDKRDYHIIIEGDGRLVRGNHAIPDNMSVHDGDYAPHCGRHNTGYIGVSVACMAGAIEVPFYAGKSPMTKKQWDVMMAVNADLCERYGIPVTPKTLCGHGAIYGHFGEANLKGKWDPLRLPWDKGLSKTDADRLIRVETSRLMDGSKSPVLPAEDLKPILVNMNGVTISDDAFNEKNKVWVPLRVLAEPMGCRIVDTDGRTVLVTDKTGKPHHLDFQIKGGVGFVKVGDLREQVGGIATEWNGIHRILKVTLV
jgi:hypothetical protein